MSVPVTGMPFKEQKWCEHCNAEAPYTCDVECFCGAQEALAELVEIRRIEDSATACFVGHDTFQRRKTAAWENAFRVCGVIGGPKP